MANDLMPMEAKQFINLTGENIDLAAPGKKEGGPMEEIPLKAENPKEWLTGKKHPEEILTMFIVDEKTLEWAKSIHRTTSDMVLILLSDDEVSYNEHDERTIKIDDLRTVSGHPVRLLVA